MLKAERGKRDDLGPALFEAEVGVGESFGGRREGSNVGEGVWWVGVAGW